MAFRVSPGVNFSEIDATQRVAPVATSDAAIAAGFQWGPADVVIQVTGESDMADVFGEPDTDTATNWLTAASFLAYSNALQVIRTIGTDAKNAVSNNTGTTGSVSIVQSGDDYSLGTIDTAGDTSNGTGLIFPIGKTEGSGAGLEVRASVTNGVVGGTPTFAVAPTTEYVDASVQYVSLIGGNNDAVIKVVKGSGDNVEGDYTITLIHGGTGYINGSVIYSVKEDSTVDQTKFDVSIDEISAGNSPAAASLTAVAAGHNLTQNDLILVKEAANTTDEDDLIIKFIGGSSAISIKNESDFDNITPPTTSAFVARYPGPLGNSLQVSMYHTGTAVQWLAWQGSFVQNGNAVTVEFNELFDRAPGTSNYVLTRNGNVSINDEVHIVVVDADGKWSGTPGKVLERFAHVSLISDAKDEQGNSNYIKDVIRHGSRYIYATGSWTEISNAINTNWTSATSSTSSVLTDGGNTADGGAISQILAGGVVDNSTTGANSNANRYTEGEKGYGILRDTEQYDVSLIISGEANNLLQISLIDDVAEYRKDAVVTISPSTEVKSTITGNGINSDKATAITDTWLTAVPNSSSYAIADSGYKRIYDRYSDTYRSIPLNGDIAGLIAQTEATREAWFSPAGFSRGNIKNAVKLYFNPDQASRDKIYKAGVNPVVSFTGQGTLLYGDKTLYKKPSAFDRINVRRLFITLEKAISRAAKQFLFEFNDEFTRSAFRGMVEPFLSDIQARRGIVDYLVVCDSSNNTAAVIDRNEFVGDIFIRPSRSINFIQLNFVAVRSGVAFSEVAGVV